MMPFLAQPRGVQVLPEFILTWDQGTLCSDLCVTGKLCRGDLADIDLSSPTGSGDTAASRH